MISDRMDINKVLMEMRAMKAQVQAPTREIDSVEINRPVSDVKQTTSFGQLLEQAVEQVNDVQVTSSNMQAAYERGEPGVNITDVMIASQKASVTFDAMVQVRNKLVEAYRDIMNMPL